MKEFRQYLELLLDHQCDTPEICPECRSLQQIYEFMRAEIFSSVVYTGTPMEEGPATESETDAHKRATAPRRGYNAKARS